MKRTTKSIAIAVLFCLIAAGMFALGASTGTTVRAQETTRAAAAPRFPKHCTIGTVSGAYAFQASGVVTQPVPQLQIPAGPFAGLTLMKLSGGTFTFNGTQSFNGTIVPAVGGGTYTVNDDCTGTAVDNFGTPYSFVIADDGDEIRIMNVAPNAAITGVARRL